ncbi:glycosyltransferase [Acinetobacter higginsii]|uniref:glycosyltransferase n=1 Tax=Acinetobacter higginsii TaxID=70347 RepID=UPI001F60D939|nr:glycosyltransferase [Acinetobacter higginsii]MCI3879172.1 CDP-glycerol glycerophosphotransferase family protein [Acinetobacter higginsii]
MFTFFRRIYTIFQSILTRRFIYGYFYNLICDISSIKKHYVLLESHHGKDFGGSPFYIAKNLATNPNFKDFHLVMVGPSHRKKWLLKQLNTKNITIIKPYSFHYAFYLATCKWLVNDVTFPLYFSRRKEQEYLNTWHGTPLKTLGRDTEKEIFSYILNTQRNFFHSTYLLAPNLYTEDLLLDTYMLRNIWEGRVVRSGYPRNDILFASRDQKLDKNQIDIAFMPTWRGNFTNQKQASFKLLEELRSLFSYLDDHLPEHITFWVRLHPMVQGYIELSGYNRINAFPKMHEAYTHLARCHALVTDYSSVMFDFATTLRPIFLYTPDEESYRSDRNMYMTLEELPFQRAENQQALLNFLLNINNVENIPPAKKYLDFIDKFCAWDKGDNTHRLCRVFFKREHEIDVYQSEVVQNKKRLLIYTGALLNNGIIRSFQTLLPLIDLDQYDITVLADFGYEIEKSENYFRSLSKNIKYIPYKSSVYMSPIQAIKAALIYCFKKKWGDNPKVLSEIWSREYCRIVGDAKFDVFINFNGYSWKIALLSLGVDYKKVIYVHNEMSKEITANRVADARLLKLSYQSADMIAIVRDGVEKEYCSTIYDYKHKVIYVPNPLLVDVKEKALAPLEVAFSRGKTSETFSIVVNALKDKSTFRFVNVARFSPEKGQIRLIKAFEKVWEINPNTQLYLIGSHGAILEEIQKIRLNSSAKASIFIVIGSDNPFPLVQCMNTFVFSSFYEGIGLVLFEAMQLGLSIISTDISGPSELLQEGYGLVVENSMDGLVHGMLAALEDNIPKKPYDFMRHNSYALNQFYRCIEISNIDE